MQYIYRPIEFKSIKEIPRDSRPREKMRSEGVSNLSDLELVCSIIGKGQKGRPVQDIAEDFLQTISSLNVANLSPEDLNGIKGLGEANSALLCASLELGRRFLSCRKKNLSRPADIFDYLRHYGDRMQEHLICIILNGALELLAIKVITVGLINRTVCHPREVFADAVALRASSIILAHNHPSGNLEPSMNDLDVTDSIEKAGRILGIRLMDHIIFCQDSYRSMLENGDYSFC
ncbi:MAG: DNA repair protein RadC [Sphaerochaetaceae bacterium]|nr:DNA repair protein RadC [Sphaerochaetaceae bacterium]